MRRYLPLLLFIGLAFAQDITIAVLEFEGKGVSQSEASILTDRFRDELFNTGSYNVLERAMMDDILKEQGFQQTGCATSECAVEVGNMLGVQQMVGGSIGKVGNIYTVSARIIDVETGKVLKSANYDHKGDIGQLLIKGMKYLAYDLTGKGLQNDTEVVAKEVKATGDEAIRKVKIEAAKISKEAEEENTREIEDDETDIGYAFELELGSPRFVNPALNNWNSAIDLRGSVELPISIKFLITKLRFGVEIGTFNFENAIPQQVVQPDTVDLMVASGDTYSGITVMGLMSFFPDSPGKIKIGAGIVGSSSGFMLEASYGFRVGKKLRIWGGIRSTEALNAETAHGITLGRAGWMDGCVGITYN